MDFTFVQSVACESCGKLHHFDEDTFIAFHGNVTVGAKGGIYGNKDNSKISVFCKHADCLSELMDKITITDLHSSYQPCRDFVGPVMCDSSGCQCGLPPIHINKEYEITDKSITDKIESIDKVEKYINENDGALGDNNEQKEGNKDIIDKLTSNNTNDEESGNDAAFSEEDFV